jgi:hypothetical protein
MSQVSGIKDLLALRDGSGSEAIVKHGGREQADAGMAMLLVVPGEEVLAKGAGILDGPETFGKVRPIFQGFEVAL